MASYNKAILIGRLTADPELKQTPSGTFVCAFSLAVDRPYKKEGAPGCDFLNVVAWRGEAEFVARYFRKGQQIFVEGQIQVRSYKDKRGETRYVTEIIADGVRFVDSKKAEDTPAAVAPGYNPYTDQESKEFEEVNVADEDLPF